MGRAGALVATESACAIENIYGEWIDESAQPFVIRPLPGQPHAFEVSSHGQIWSPTSGTVNAQSIGLLGTAGAFDASCEQIRWSNGVVWLKAADVTPSSGARSRFRSPKCSCDSPDEATGCRCSEIARASSQDEGQFCPTSWRILSYADRESLVVDEPNDGLVGWAAVDRELRVHFDQQTAVIDRADVSDGCHLLMRDLLCLSASSTNIPPCRDLCIFLDQVR